MNPEFIALDASRIDAGLFHPERFRVEVQPTIDSTSSALKRRAETGDIDRAVIVAETQSAGRGRHGRSWVDQPGRSLLFSLGWQPALDASVLAGLSLAAGVAVCLALEEQDIAGVRLKWPNDVLHNHCKLGGILVETVTGATGLGVVLGIGLNVSLDTSLRASIAAPVTDLAAAGWHGDRNVLLAAILGQLDVALERFRRDGFRSFRAEWLARHALQQRNVRIWRDGQEIAAGRAIDVDADGALLIQTTAGVRRLLSGELTLRAG